MRRALRPVRSQASVVPLPPKLSRTVSPRREDRVGNKGHRLDSGVHCEVRQAIQPETVSAGIAPNVRTISSVPSELDIVGVFAAPIFPDENQFMLAPVK